MQTATKRYRGPICGGCAEPFQPSAIGNTYCSPRCRAAAKRARQREGEPAPAIRFHCEACRVPVLAGGRGRPAQPPFCGACRRAGGAAAGGGSKP